MRQYHELNSMEREKALIVAQGQLLRAIVSGRMAFNDKLNGDDLQARINTAIAKAEENLTPWFAAEYVWDAARDEIESMAVCDAEDAWYPDADDRVLVLAYA